jgi:hypothetical protein
LQFLGYSPDAPRARPGDDVRLRFFWKVKRDPGRKDTIGVFVHLESRHARFQADHHFLSGHAKGVWPVLEGEVFSQDAWISVPAGAAPGPHRILVGVYDLPTGRRWKVSASDAAAQRERVPIGTLEIEAAQTR